MFLEKTPVDLSNHKKDEECKEDEYIIQSETAAVAEEVEKLIS